MEKFTGLCTASIGLPALGPSLPLVVSSFIGFFVLQKASKIFSPRLFPKSFVGLSKKTKLDWDLHFVSLNFNVYVAFLYCIIKSRSDWSDLLCYCIRDYQAFLDVYYNEFIETDIKFIVIIRLVGFTL